MSRPVKRGFPTQDTNGSEFGNLTEAQYNISTSHTKRQLRVFDNRHSVVAVASPCTVQQETFSSKVPDSTDPQPAFTDTLEPGCGVLFHDNADWAFNLQTDISDLPLSFFASRHSGIPGHGFSAMLDPDFRYAEGTATDTDLQMTNDLGSGNSNTRVSGQSTSYDILNQDFGNVDSVRTVPPVGNHVLTGTNISWINDGEQRPV